MHFLSHPRVLCTLLSAPATVWGRLASLLATAQFPKSKVSQVNDALESDRSFLCVAHPCNSLPPPCRLILPASTASLASVEEQKPRATDYLGSKGTFLDLVASPLTDREIL